MLKFEEFHSHMLDTGDDIRIEKQSWDCVIPCVVIGAMEDGSPVLQVPGGPRVNKDELVKRGVLRTKGKPGQVPIEVMTLGPYLKIEPEELKGKAITIVRSLSWEFLIICEDKTYVKLSPVTQYNETTFDNDDLTMQDLRSLNQISEEVFEKCDAQRIQVREAARIKEGGRKLKHVLKELGVDRVKSIVDLAAKENA